MVTRGNPLASSSAYNGIARLILVASFINHYKARQDEHGQFAVDEGAGMIGHWSRTSGMNGNFPNLTTLFPSKIVEVRSQPTRPHVSYSN